MTIMFLAFYYINVKIDENIKNNTRLQYILNFILAFLWLCSEGFNTNDTIIVLYASSGQIIKSLIYVYFGLL